MKQNKNNCFVFVNDDSFGEKYSTCLTISVPGANTVFSQIGGEFAASESRSQGQRKDTRHATLLSASGNFRRFYFQTDRRLKRP